MAPMRKPSPTTTRVALSGAVTAVAGALVAEASAAVLMLDAGPTRAVAAAIRDLTPGSWAIKLVHLVGHWDKPLLVLGTLAGLACVGGLAGLATRRSLTRGRAVFAVLAGIGALATATSGSTGLSAFVPVLIGLILWWSLLGWLTTPTAQAEGRRAFLLRTGLVAAGALAVGAGGWAFGRRRRRLEEARALLRLPVKPGVVPPGADVGLEGVAPWRTPNADFYRIDTALSVPSLTPEEWRLRIHGMVDREITVTYEDLVSAELQSAWVTLCCVSNVVGGDLIGNAYWSGIPVRTLLQRAGVQEGADAVKQTSADGWTCGTPLEALTDDRSALLAVAMNGKPLPVEHGFPVRMVVPGLYGYVSATKWVVDLEVTRFADFSAYWTGRGWAERGPIKTQSRIDVPRDGATQGVGPARFGGVAWAQHTGIAAVEVQLDGGPWLPAVLGEGYADDTWVQWSVAATLTEGDHVLVVRATDKSGRTQTGVRTDVAPDGATGWHSVRFTAS